jgi:hypothetical protein
VKLKLSKKYRFTQSRKVSRKAQRQIGSALKVNPSLGPDRDILSF